MNDDHENQHQPIGADRSIDLAIEQGEATVFESNTPRRKLSLRLLFIIVATIVTVVCVLVFVVLQPAKKQAADPLAAATHFASAQALVDEVEPSVKAKVMNTKFVNGVNASDAEGYYTYGVPAYRWGDAKFSVLPMTMTGQGYLASSSQASTDYKALVDFFAEHKFVKKASEVDTTGTVSDIDNSVKYIAYAEYESSNLLCAIRHADATPTKLAAHIVSVGCADKESYAEATKKLQPFYDLYAEGDASSSSDTTLGFLEQGNGDDDYTYQTLYRYDPSQFSEGEEVVSLVGYYYKKSSETKWTYFMDMNVGETPFCSTFDTPVLKKAFKNVDCYDDEQQKDIIVGQKA